MANPYSTGSQVSKTNQTVKNATVLNGATSSDVVDLENFRAAAIVAPSGVTATSVTFQASMDGSNFYPLYDAAGNQITGVIGASRVVALGDKLASFYGLRYLKLVLNAAPSSDIILQVLAEA